jgi:hypothetical protein
MLRAPHFRSSYWNWFLLHRFLLAAETNHSCRYAPRAHAWGDKRRPFQHPRIRRDRIGNANFSTDNAWNEDVSRRPLLSNSTAMISQIFSELTPWAQTDRSSGPFNEMNFALVPNQQPTVPIQFTDYPTNPIPVPTHPVESADRGMALHNRQPTLTQVQRNRGRRDRHAIIIQPAPWLHLEPGARS